MVLLWRVVCSGILLFTASSALLADVKSDATTKIIQYYSLLQQYASDPSRVELNDRIKNLFVDGQGCVYNDIYTVVYNNPVTNSDILNYITAIGAYKNKSGGHILNIEVDQNLFQYKVKNSQTVYVTVSKRVSCRQGNNPVDFVTKEVVLFQNNKIVCVFKEGSVNLDERNTLVINNIEFGSCYNNKEILAEFGSVLYACEIPYLNMRFSYSSSSATDIYVKIINPQGQLVVDRFSPSGYSTKYTLSPSSTGTFISGVGDESKTVYYPGNYTVEVWSENQKLYSKNIYLHSSGKPATYFELTNDEIIPSIEGVGEGRWYTVRYDTDGETITAYTNSDWITATVLKASSLIGIEVTPNAGPRRTGIVYVEATGTPYNFKEKIKVVQKGKASKISLDFSSWTFDTDSDYDYFDVNTDGDESLSANTYADWITASITSSGRLKVSVSKNFGSPREGTVYVKCGCKSTSIKIKQKGYHLL